MVGGSARWHGSDALGGDRYKPSALRGYEAALRQRILPELGASKLSDVRRVDVQDLADRLLAGGLDPSTIRNALMPLRAIYRRGLSRGEVVVNPTSGLELPAVRGRRERIASPAEAARLLAAVPEQARAVWAAALYGGLRRGELMALRWEDVDLDEGVIRVVRGWDMHAGVIETKNSRRRVVPIIAVLRHHLTEHQARTQRETGLVFGRTPERPFEPVSLRARALSSWKQAGLDPISLHQGRHTFASLMIASGVNAKALTAYLGHSSIVISHDRYGHLMPGSDSEAVALIDGYLDRADSSDSLPSSTRMPPAS